MSDYNEQRVNGTRWQRCTYIGINNPRPHLGVPAVTFVEEQLVLLDGEEVIRPLGNLVESFTPENAGEMFEIVHPKTGAVVGNSTYEDLYVLLTSAYRHIALKRDQAQRSDESPLAE